MKTSPGPVGLLAFACLAAAAIGELIVIPAGGLSLPAFWPLSGVLVGALLTTDGIRGMAAVTAFGAAAMVAAEVLRGQPTAVAVPLAVLFAVEGVVAACVLRRVCGAFSLTELTHIWALVVASAVVPMAGAAVAAGVLALDGLAPTPIFWTWWLMNGVGTLVITPLVVAAASGVLRLRAGRASRGAEIAVVLAAGASLSHVLFGGQLDPIVRVPAYLLPFFLWSVFRFGVAGTAATLLLVCEIGLWHSAQGRGPFALPGASPAEWVLRTQGTMFVAVASLLLMAGAVAERRRVARENELLVTDLQKALAEIKTLRGFIPLCAWCHKVRDDAGFWQEIENYLDARTDATVSHSICPGCVEQAEQEIDQHAAVRLRLADGRRSDPLVERDAVQRPATA